MTKRKLVAFWVFFFACFLWAWGWAGFALNGKVVVIMLSIVLLISTLLFAIVSPLFLIAGFLKNQEISTAGNLIRESLFWWLSFGIACIAFYSLCSSMYGNANPSQWIWKDPSKQAQM